MLIVRISHRSSKRPEIAEAIRFDLGDGPNLPDCRADRGSQVVWGEAVSQGCSEHDGVPVIRGETELTPD